MNRTPRSLLTLAVAGLLACSAVGCATKQNGKWKFASWDVKRSLGMKSDKPPAPQVPQRLIATWVDTTLHTAGQKPQRGFGGRIVFFGPQGEDSVRVEGELVVYAFDETEREPHETQPTRRYIFPVEQFAKHESPSRFGPSYSVWLPWDEVGGDQRRVSLIARFEPQGGPMIVSEQTNHLLPGIVRPERAMADAPGRYNPPPTVAAGVTQASFQGGDEAALAGGKQIEPLNRRRATTIALPEKMTERLATAQQNSQRERLARIRAATNTGLAGSTSPQSTTAPPATSAATAKSPSSPAERPQVGPAGAPVAEAWAWPSGLPTTATNRPAH